MQIRLCAFADEAASDLKGQIDALKHNNIKLIELRNVGGKNVADLTLVEATNIKQQLDSAKIEVFSIGSPIGKSSLNQPREYEENRLRHLISIAKILGADKMRMFSYFTTKFDEDANEIVERLRRLVDIAAQSDIKLCHENEKEIFGDIASRVELLRKAVPDMKTVYDPANFVQTGEDADYCIANLATKAEYLHIKDVISATSELVPPGMGDGKIFQLVNSLNRDMVLSIEPHLAVFDGYASIDNTKMKNKFSFKSNLEAFNAAVTALKVILNQCGYVEEQTSWTRR